MLRTSNRNDRDGVRFLPVVVVVAALVALAGLVSVRTGGAAPAIHAGSAQ